MFSIFSYGIIIFVFALSPIPALPIMVLNYKINGLVGGFIAAFFGSNLSAIIQFYLGKYSFNFLIKKFPLFYKKISRYKPLINQMSFAELITFLLSAHIPSIIKTTALGAASINLKRFFIVIVISQSITQLILIFASFQFSDLYANQDYLELKNFKGLLLSISLSSFLVFSLLFFLRNFKIIKKIFNKFLKLKINQ